MKRYLLLKIFFTALALHVATTTAFASDVTLYRQAIAEPIAIDAANFPDDKFRDILLAQPYGDDALLSSDEISWITNMLIDDAEIEDLTGIEYFTALKSLYCSFNYLTSLPTLPGSLESLYCFDNPLTSLPDLPASLITLYCASNRLTLLPTLPASLESLDCDNNQLTSLPTLPASMKYLDFSLNQLTSLPTLPANLGYLDCSYNQLTSLPTLPASLKILGCSYNRLTEIALNESASYSNIRASYNLMTDESKVTGQTIEWGSEKFVFAPQRTAGYDYITSIAVKTPPAKTAYNLGDELDLTGLVITINYSISAPEDVEYDWDFYPKGFTYSPSNVSLGDDHVTVTHFASGETVDIAITVTDDSYINDLPPSAAKAVGYYTISGQRLSKAPESGIYIIKFSDGTAKKIFRKK
jgi:hypothetical protein